MKFPLGKVVDLLTPLTPDSKVIEIGGYKGEFTQEIVKRCNCCVWIFEPVPYLAEACRQTFKENRKVWVVEKAIGTDTIYLNRNRSSLDKGWARSDKEIKVAKGKWNDLLIIPNLLKINCEGGEYEALEEDFSQVPEILVQFHKINGWQEKIKKAKDKLNLTHTCVYSKKWDLWRKK